MGTDGTEAGEEDGKLGLPSYSHVKKVICTPPWRKCRHGGHFVHVAGAAKSSRLRGGSFRDCTRREWGPDASIWRWQQHSSGGNRGPLPAPEPEWEGDRGGHRTTRLHAGVARFGLGLAAPLPMRPFLVHRDITAEGMPGIPRRFVWTSGCGLCWRPRERGDSRMMSGRRKMSERAPESLGPEFLCPRLRTA